jgi:riboflavin biosynthesis pyrimidine reductase
VPGFYQDLTYPKAPEGRPYVVINMVATIDGKIITGERGEPVHDLGSETDHQMMRRIQKSVDAILIGAENQRSTPKIRYPPDKYRIVVTRSGDVLYPSRFFDDAPDKSIVFCTDESKLPHLPEGVRIERLGRSSVDWRAVLSLLRDIGIERLLVEGGSEINAQILRMEIPDELFLTVAPKIKLGAETPTYADGDPLARTDVQNYRLIESHVHGDEVFLRYRRNRE